MKSLLMGGILHGKPVQSFSEINVNYPGIGRGGLPKECVAPLLRGLPKNVNVWEKE